MAKQGTLEGIGPKQIEEIDEAAEELRALRAERQELEEKEEEAQVKLAELLKKHGYTGKRKYLMEIENGDGKLIKFDAFLERPEARAYVRKHKNPKEGDEGGTGNGTDED